MLNLIYIYPQIDFINNEINIFRIIDEEIKETIVIFGINKKNYIEIYSTNTYTGENKLVKKIDSIQEIDLFINKLKANEFNLLSKNDLFEVEKYILKDMCF